MMEKERKLLWWDEGRRKTAKGTGYEIEKDNKGGMIIIFHGNEGDIILTPNSHNGHWSIT